MKNSFKVAFGGIICALSATLMFCSSILPFTQYAIPVFTGIALVAVVIELGKTWAWIAFAAVSLVCLLIVPNKEPVALYILFFGYYPILKSLFESSGNFILEWLLKLVVFNAAMIAFFYAGLYLIGIKPEEYSLFGVNLPIVFLIAGNILFVVYDILLSRTIVIYIHKIHPYFKKMFKTDK
ncbi:MAG: hypothetical protein IJL87_05735 [Clostridia bacterium]|nr:hypothetical protein [Clostridia bacterium]